MTVSFRPWLLAACVAACSGGTQSQVLTGTITTSGAVAVRAVSGGDVVTAARVRSDGSFTLALPVGNTYRLELLTGNGVKPVLGVGFTALEFAVCQPEQPFDCGGMGGNGQCDPSTDPKCGCTVEADGTTTCPPPPPPPPPPWCDPSSDPSCPCKIDANGQIVCPPPPPPPCDASTDPTCPPPPCSDPNDPSTCKDPCMTDPSQCGCAPDAAGSNGQCWPPPQPPPCDASGKCSGGGVVPQHPPGDFGCKEPSGS